jgi:hypothetical protein
VNQAASFELGAKRVPDEVRTAQGASTRAVVGKTLLAMVVVAVVWVGLGLLWSQLFSEPTTSATGAFQVPFPLHPSSSVMGWTLMVRDQVAIIPEQIRAFDFPALGASFGKLLQLIIGLLTGPLLGQ